MQLCLDFVCESSVSKMVAVEMARRCLAAQADGKSRLEDLVLRSPLIRGREVFCLRLYQSRFVFTSTSYGICLCDSLQINYAAFNCAFEFQKWIEIEYFGKRTLK